ncbi:MAG: hypothetical protein OXE42_10355, partial [Gammaproteobacteria bacterium]|nr:hypothetical protein [Gammaproteobacteria bacterium]
PRAVSPDGYLARRCRFRQGGDGLKSAPRAVSPDGYLARRCRFRQGGDGLKSVPGDAWRI